MTDSVALPPVPSPVQMAIDEEHLRLFKIAYYIAGGVTAGFSSLLVIHFSMLLVFALNPQMFAQSTSQNGQHVTPPPPGMFFGFAAVIGLIIIVGWTFGLAQLYAARCLGRQKNLPLVLIVAGFECVFIPWGTAIGVFSFITLSRPSVKALFTRA